MMMWAWCKKVAKCRCCTTSSPRAAPGFTLIEFIVVIIIAGVVFSVMGPLLFLGFRASKLQYTWSGVTGQGRAALSRMTRELRNIRSNSSTNLSSMSANTITFIDLDGNQITYSLSNGNLMRGANILAQNTSGLTFAYYDANGAVTAVSTNVQYVGLVFTVSDGTVSETYRDDVYLRNAS
jgi:prepilin-type N-terminal cleavage/methylation domain-containing protein